MNISVFLNCRPMTIEIPIQR